MYRIFLQLCSGLIKIDQIHLVFPSIYQILFLFQKYSYYTIIEFINIKNTVSIKIPV